MKRQILLILVLCFVAIGFAEPETNMEKAESIFYDPPLPVTLIGSKLGDQVNFMTAAWVTRVEVDPYMFAVSIQKKHFSHKAIMESKSFSICVPSTDLLPQTDAVGMASGREYDKSKVFDVFYGDNPSVPMVDGAVVCYECALVNPVSITELDDEHPNAHTLFIGEVKNVWVNKSSVKDGALDYETFKPIIWTFSPMSYWTLGENFGKSHNPDNLKLVPKKE